MFFGYIKNNMETLESSIIICGSSLHSNRTLPLQAASEASRLSGYDAPRLLSLVHLAQLLSIEAASNLTADVQLTAAGTLFPQRNPKTESPSSGMCLVGLLTFKLHVRDAQEEDESLRKRTLRSF
jgi:hypothetical protein